jgi:hypothetical protein
MATAIEVDSWSDGNGADEAELIYLVPDFCIEGFHWLY